jgi:hypothetical protein
LVPRQKYPASPASGPCTAASLDRPGQLTPLVTVLRAEQARRTAGIAVSRPAWKNLIFTGGPGTGKSRAATAIARLYRDLDVLCDGNLIEIHAADLAGATPGTPRRRSAKRSRSPATW